MNVDFNTDADHINIPLNRYGLIWLLFLVFGVLALGIGFIASPKTFVVANGYRFHSLTEIFIMGIFFVIVCGPVFILMLYTLITNKPGLSITEDGIIENASLAALGFIQWDDITALTNEESSYPVCIIVHTKDSEQYVKNQRNIFKRYFASSNYKRYGYPFVINTYNLKCDFNELNTFLSDTLKIYQKDSKSLPE